MTTHRKKYNGIRIGLLLILITLGFFVTTSTFPNSGTLTSNSESHAPHSPKRRTSEHTSKTKETPECFRPVMELWPPGFKKLSKRRPPPNCSKKENWIYTRNGSIFISKQAQETHGEIVCQGRLIKRGDDDFTVMYGDRIKPFWNTTILTSDFVEVTCVAEDGTKYNNVHAGIRQDLKLHKNVKKSAYGDINRLGLNVLMFAFDSVSRMMWRRDLPKTHKYLVDVLGASVLEGYNIVGDGTLAALLPILTDKTETELPESVRERKHSTPVDGHPWIWKELKQLGYITQFGEDAPNIGSFTYRRTGFMSQPTDHYMRPFYIKAQERYKKESAFCLGSLTRLQVLLNWLKEFYQMYPDRSKFSLLFHNEYSHDHIDKLNWADKDVVELLDFLNTEGHLDNTLLIVMSDHGQRTHRVRWTLPGKYEERLPFFSIRLPPRFRKQHPDVMKNVRVNSKRLTTPFDIYATLRDVVNFTGGGVGDVRNRGISLFKEIPRERTCADAGIEPHWCTCLNWVDVGTNDALVRRAAKHVVALINKATMEHRGQCVELSLLNISSAAQFSPNKRFIKFSGSADKTNRVAVFKRGRTKISEKLFQVTFVTKPNLAIYEATVKYFVSQNTFVGNTDEISRINRYANQPHCVMKEQPILRPYCYCYIQLPWDNEDDP